MSLKTLPIIFLNMGGEMVYILDQRLQAQSVKAPKAAKVLEDIVGTMFNPKFVDELFKPQELYSRRAMRSLFDKLAHASIMRLNTSSMDKLYDLMTMAIKYQLLNATSPKDILLITLNHLDGVRKLVQGAADIQGHIDHAYKAMSETYFEMNPWELGMIQQTLLSFYQDARIKVSLLLREKKQKDDGRFIINIKNVKLPNSEYLGPGYIKKYRKGAVDKDVTFIPGPTYQPPSKMPNLTKTCKVGERICTLGLNVYRTTGVDIQGGFGSSALRNPIFDDSAPRGNYKQASTASELSLLCKLIRNPGGSASSTPDFTLNLFENPEEEKGFVKEAQLAVKQAEQKPAGQIIRIDARNRNRNGNGSGGGSQDGFNSMFNDLSLSSSSASTHSNNSSSGGKSRGQNLLDLMDKV